MVVSAPQGSESTSGSSVTIPPTFPLAMPSNLTAEDWMGLIRAFQSPAPPFPEFYGHDYEDPRKYLHNCERYFRTARTDPDQRTQLVNKGLKGDAQKWWSLYKDLCFSWDDFESFFLSKFANPTAVMRLQASLYSHTQGEKEPVAVFLQQKFLLAKRLNVPLSPMELTSLLLESVKPALRCLIRPTNPSSFPELLEAATKAEKDVADCAARKPTPVREEAPRKPKPENTDSKQLRLPPCHYCPEHHYHRDCPVFQAQRPRSTPENWRAPAGASAPAPVETKPQS
ncbi:activity-regulated cytoskeleton-associated protein-like [Leptopilina heterotoma]|uniref:activity-regulated cytoskeleton-associated protein-like n=1 Tax=Leptopilina heterotoma TaxID=63436 RepID=UPI001CA7FEAC|nr:activity-regulated cytoskeleton-associated protein-like [Leptopilina heterotoma]